MVFDVGRDVFVMRVRDLQRRFVGVRLAVIPEQFLFAPPDFVTVGFNLNRFPVGRQSFDEHKPVTIGEVDFPAHPRQRCTPADERHGGLAYGFEPFRQVVEEQFVILQGAKRLAHAAA